MGMPGEAVRHWREWLRWLLLLLFLLASAPLTSAARNPALGGGPRVLAMLLQPLIFLIVVGTVYWIILRVRNRDRPGWQATFSPGPMLIAFGLVALSSLGQGS